MKAEKFSPSPTGSRIVKRTLPGGIAVEHAQHDRLDGEDGLGAAFAGGLQQQQRMPREGQQQRQGEIALRRPQPLVLGHAPFDPRQLHLARAETDRRRDFGRRRPVLPVLAVPVGKQAVAAVADPLHRRLKPLQAGLPAVGQFGPLPLVLPLVGLDRLVVLPAKRLHVGGIAAFQLGDQAADTWRRPRPATGRAG